MINKIARRLKKILSKNKKLLLETVTTFVIRVSSAIISFVMNALIGRYLGADQSGYFFLALQLVTVLSTFSRLGADNILLRYVSIYRGKNDWNNVQSVIMVLFKRTIFFSFIITPVIAIGSHYLAYDIFKKPLSQPTLLWMGLSIPFYAGYMLISFAFQGIKKAGYLIIIQGTFLPALLIIYIIFFKPFNAHQLSLAYFVVSILTLVVCYILWKNKSEGTAGYYEEKNKLVAETKPLLVIIILQPLMQLAGQFVAGRYVAAAELGQLAVAQRTSLLMAFVLIIVNLTSAPRFAVFYHNKNIKGLKRYIKTVSRLLAVITIPFTLLVVIFANPIMGLYGKDFVAGGILLRIFAIGQFVNLITGSVTNLLIMTGHQKDIRNISIANGIFTLILIISLTPKFGAIGSAFATSLGMATQNLLCFFFVKKRIGISTLPF